MLLTLLTSGIDISAAGAMMRPLQHYINSIPLTKAPLHSKAPLFPGTLEQRVALLSPPEAENFEK